MVDGFGAFGKLLFLIPNTLYETGSTSELLLSQETTEQSVRADNQPNRTQPTTIDCQRKY
jgi:hypothetical protein